LLYNITNSFSGSTRMDWSAASGWAASVNMPAALPGNPYYYTYGITRAGDMLIVDTINYGSYGGSATYDARRNLMITTVPITSTSTGYVLGFPKNPLDYGGAVLSVSGVGFTDLLVKYDTLPTPAVPAGDGRNVTNLWGVFFK
jgi:hypothetical protein